LERGRVRSQGTRKAERGPTIRDRRLSVSKNERAKIHTFQAITERNTGKPTRGRPRQRGEVPFRKLNHKHGQNRTWNFGESYNRETGVGQRAPRSASTEKRTYDEPRIQQKLIEGEDSRVSFSLSA